MKDAVTSSGTRPKSLTDGFECAGFKMNATGITVRRGVNELLNRLFGRSDIEFPCAARHYEEAVSMPVYPALTESALSHCLTAARSAFAGGS
jgi:dTDP-4-amino-4,6-dideoxygalactose transaminase